MKKIILVIIIFFIFNINTKAALTSASSAILMDMDSKRILYAEDIHKTQSVASISKIMTGYIACESGKLSNTVTVGDEIELAYGSSVYIKKDEKLTLKDLTYALMLRSGNDASLSIATYLSKSETNFVNLMNQKAKEIGMKNTIFNNPNGLDDNTKGNISSAFDMALLTSEAMKNSDYREIVKTKTYKLKTNKNTYIWNNKNKLLKTYKYTTGGKTGYTVKAKRTLVSTASKDNLNLVVVTLNDGNDFKDHVNLFEYGYNNYTNHQILKKGLFNIYDDKYYKDYKLYINENFSYPIMNTEISNIVLKIELDKEKKHKKNSLVGTVKVLLNDEIIHEQGIYIKDVKQKSSILKTIKKWFEFD